MSTRASPLALRSLFPTLAVIVALGLAGCNTLPERESALEDARAAVSAAHADGTVVTYAGLELAQADDALRRADAAWRERADSVEVDHLAYLARRRAAIAVETARLRAADAAVVTATADRDRALLLARTREAERAQHDAALAQLHAEATQRHADEMRMEAALAHERAAASQAQAQDAEARARSLAAELADLQAQRTDRGIVVTLGDVLFDPGRAELKPGGIRVLQRVADFLGDYPHRVVVIEGFTDSVGSEGLNQDLSERRANAVRLALLQMNVDPRRITARGYGKAFPVASNDTPVGRQLNRRVEVVISDDNGMIGPRRGAPEQIGGLR